MAGDEVDSAERAEAQTFSVPVGPLRVNGVPPSDGDMCKFEVFGKAVGDPSNGFINIEPKTINGEDVPNPVSSDNTGDGSGPESNDENDDLEQARSQYNEQSLGGSPGY